MRIHTDWRPRKRWGMLGFLALALVGCGDSKPTSDLIDQSKSKDSADRTQAVRGLAARKTEADTVAPVLADALRDEDAFVRRDAARALAQLGPAAVAAVPALRIAARDKNLHVRQAAADALQKVAPDLAPDPQRR
jgi:HEAT repeat protein